MPEQDPEWPAAMWGVPIVSLALVALWWWAAETGRLQEALQACRAWWPGC